MIGLVHLLGDVAFRGQSQCFGRESRIVWCIGQHASEGFDKGIGKPGSAARTEFADTAQEQIERQSLPGFPAVESVPVVCHQVAKLRVREIKTQVDRGGKTAQQGWDRRLQNIHEFEFFLRFGQ